MTMNLTEWRSAKDSILGSLSLVILFTQNFEILIESNNLSSLVSISLSSKLKFYLQAKNISKVTRP